MNQDENNINDNENDTIYFTENREYEQNSDEYSRYDMHQESRPMTNTNSVEYDENDYESANYSEKEKNRGINKKIIFSYIIAIVIVLIVILIAYLKL